MCSSLEVWTLAPAGVLPGRAIAPGLPLGLPHQDLRRPGVYHLVDRGADDRPLDARQVLGPDGVVLVPGLPLRRWTLVKPDPVSEVLVLQALEEPVERLGWELHEDHVIPAALLVAAE